MKKKGQHPYSSKTEIEKKNPKNLTIDIDGLIIQEQTLLSAYKQNMHKAGKLAKKYLFLVFLLIQITVFAQKVNNRISNKKQIENIVQWYAVEDWNRNGIREFVIEKCSKTLKENGLDILKPGYVQVDAAFTDTDNCDMESLLKGQCPNYNLEDDEYIRYAWRIERGGKRWDLVTLEIEKFGIKHRMYETKDK